MNYGKLTAGTTKTAIDTAKPSEKGEIITYLSRMGDVLHGKLERCHQVIILGIEVTAGCQIADAVFRKIAFCVVAGFRHVTSQAGQVFGNDRVDLTGFQMFQHGTKTGAFKVAAGVAVVGKFLH